MKNRLGLSSEQFLKEYTEPHTGEKTRFPMLKLKMDDKTLTCPFVGAEGCSIYEDRPGACRIYPLGRAASHSGGGGTKEHYFIVSEAHCLGHNEDKEWTVKEWREDQGVDEYNEMNDYWSGVITDAAALTQKELSSKKLQMFYLASYNLDSFRKFVFETRFLDMFDVDDEVVDEIKRDEVALMRFAIDWLRFSLFGEKMLKMRDVVVEAKKKELGLGEASK
jgi:Fe-S-cluster containining protein